MNLQDIIAILGMDELSDEEKDFDLLVHASYSVLLVPKLPTLRNNLQVNQDLMFQ